MFCRLRLLDEGRPKLPLSFVRRKEVRVLKRYGAVQNSFRALLAGHYALEAGALPLPYCL